MKTLRFLICAITLALPLSAFAQSFGPPAGTKVVDDTVATKQKDFFRFAAKDGTVYLLIEADTTGGDTVKFDLVNFDAFVFEQPVVLTAAGYVSNLGLNTVENLVGNDGSRFGTNGFRLPYELSPTPSSEAVTVWDSDNDRIGIGNGSSTSWFYPGNTAFELAYGTSWSAEGSYTMGATLTVDTSGGGGGGTSDSVGVDLDGDDALDAFLYGTDSSIFTLKQGTNVTLGLDTVAGQQRLTISASPGTASDYWDTTVNLDQVSYSFEDGTGLVLTDSAGAVTEWTVIDAGGNHYFKFTSPIYLDENPIYDATQIQTDEDFRVLLGTGSGAYQDFTLYFQSAAGADSFKVQHGTVIYGEWQATPIDPDYIAQDGASANEFMGWTGSEWSPLPIPTETPFASNGDSTIVWTNGADTVFGMQLMADGYARIFSDFQMVFAGSGDGRPFIDFSDDTTVYIDSTLWDSVLTQVRHFVASTDGDEQVYLDIDAAGTTNDSKVRLMADTTPGSFSGMYADATDGDIAGSDYVRYGMTREGMGMVRHSDGANQIAFMIGTDTSIVTDSTGVYSFTTDPDSLLQTRIGVLSLISGEKDIIRDTAYEVIEDSLLSVARSLPDSAVDREYRWYRPTSIVGLGYQVNDSILSRMHWRDKANTMLWDLLIYATTITTGDRDTVEFEFFFEDAATVDSLAVTHAALGDSGVVQYDIYGPDQSNGFSYMCDSLYSGPNSVEWDDGTLATPVATKIELASSIAVAAGEALSVRLIYDFRANNDTTCTSVRLGGDD